MKAKTDTRLFDAYDKVRVAVSSSFDLFYLAVEAFKTAIGIRQTSTV